jgi:hypothetical protein
MITNKGRQIIAKYVLGQAPSFASYIAAGCGPKPLLNSGSASILPSKESLDFEMFRVPIISRGFIKEGNVEKLVLKAEMPTDQRYLITELGVFPSESNSVAGQYDSKLMITFAPTESWVYSDGQNASAVPYINSPVDSQNNSASIDASTPDFLFINSDMNIFSNTNRADRYEAPRFLNRALMVHSNTASINSSFATSASSRYIENSNILFNFGQNLPDDEIKLAFSLVSKTANQSTNPDVRILMELYNNISGSNNGVPKAVVKYTLPASTFTNSRYQVIPKKISEFEKETNFSWANVNMIRIYASTFTAGTNNINNDYYIIYDGIRIDNLTAENPLYSLIGYNIVKNTEAEPIDKLENTNNYVEYRFGISVV